MKKIIILTILLSSILFAANNKKESIAEKQLRIQMEKEKKYSKEQKFYQGKNYDLKAAEINLDSLSSIPDDDEEDDFDMDDVY